MKQIEALEPVRKKMDAEIVKLTAKVPEYLFTLPGATELTIVSLYGEVSPIEAFEKPSQLVAFAGLDPKVFQSGQPAATGASTAGMMLHADASANAARRTLDGHYGRWHIGHYAPRAICVIFGEENIAKISITWLLLLPLPINCAILFGES